MVDEFVDAHTGEVDPLGAGEVGDVAVVGVRVDERLRVEARPPRKRPVLYIAVRLFLIVAPAVATSIRSVRGRCP